MWPHRCTQVCKGVRHRGEVDMHKCVNACIPCGQGVNQRRIGWEMQTWLQKHTNVCKLQEGVGQLWGVRWTNIYILLHVHFLVKV